MSSKITINKLLKTRHDAGDKKNYIYLQANCEDGQINVKILDSESGKSYQGIVTVADMKEIASNLGMPYNDYYEEVLLALSTYIALPGFYYKLEPEMDVLNVWKSQPESVPILFLDINIKAIINNHEILDTAIELLQQQDKSLADRVQKAYKFDEHSRELLEDYRLCVDEKNGLERKLLKKVAVLLNAKKERIDQLEKRLKKYENVKGNQQNNDSENEEDPQPSKKRLVLDSDSGDDEYMANTQPLTVPRDDNNRDS